MAAAVRADLWQQLGAAIEMLENALLAWKRRRFGSLDGTALELLLYNMRHVQHHTAQLNLILRQETDSAPGWVARGR